MENRTKRIKIDTDLKRKLIIEVTLVKKIKIDQKDQKEQVKKYTDEMTWFRIYGG